MQGEQHKLLEEWVTSIRMHEMHADCHPSANLKDGESERQRQRVERKLAQVRARVHQTSYTVVWFGSWRSLSTILCYISISC